jgi:hypothetical protein
MKIDWEEAANAAVIVSVVAVSGGVMIIVTMVVGKLVLRWLG